MKMIAVVCLCILLAGCELFTRIETRTETRYVPIFPPEYLTTECLPERPEKASLGDLLEIQNRALNQCNNQILTIREWVELERTQLQKREEANED